MADQSKSPFSFANPTSGNSSGALFGQPSTASSQPPSNLFGSSNKPPSTSAPSLFGATPTATSGSSLFGAGASAPGQSSGLFGSGGGASGGSNTLFGGGTNKPTPSFSFGQNSAGQSSGEKPSLFGQAQSSSNQQSGISAPSLSFATPSKAMDSGNAGSGQASNLFGGGSSNPFQNPTSSAPGSAATPTSKSTWSFAPLGSTTPAGPPPSNQTSTSNPFGQIPNNQQQEKKSLFPSLGGGSSTSQSGTSTSIAPATQNATAPGTGLLGNLGKPSSAQPPGSTGSGGMLGNLGGQSSSGSSTAPAAPSLYSNQAQSSAPEAQKPNFSFNPSSSSQTSTQNPQKTQEPAPSLFGLGGQSKPPSSSASTAPAPVTSMFPNTGKQGGSSTSAAPSTSLFNNLNTHNLNAAPPPSSGTATPSLFSNLAKPQDNPPATSSQTQAQIPSLTSNLFNNTGQSSTSAAPSEPTHATKAGTSGPPSGANAAANSNLGTSTNGPAPSAQSRLKNKSMDEIITRWASDLAKYQKEFQKQAEKVASWDRMLVDNSEKIQKLYGSTLEAERATVEVERQITAVENDQNELESWLDRYEKEVDQMISNQSDSFQGPDLERERTYV